MLEVLLLVVGIELGITVGTRRHLDVVHRSELGGNLVRNFVLAHLGSKKGLHMTSDLFSYIITLSPNLQSTARERLQQADAEILVAQLLEVVQLVISVEEEIGAATVRTEQQRLTFLALHGHLEDDVRHGSYSVSAFINSAYR